MKPCPICCSDVLDATEECDCGYDFLEGEVIDEEKIRAHLAKFEKSEWVKVVSLKKRIHEVQVKKHGRALSGPGSGWRIEDTANLLGESRAISDDINLAEALERYPPLLECKNKSNAQRMLKEIKGSPNRSHVSPVKSEDDLQKYLEKNWQKTKLGRDWTLYGSGKFDTHKVGIMDLLAHHKSEPRWLVVELKRDQSSDKTVGQLLRYMGWVKQHLAKNDEVIHGLVVLKRATSEILYALECVPDVKLMRYSWEDGVLELTRISFQSESVRRLSTEEILRVTRARMSEKSTQ